MAARGKEQVFVRSPASFAFGDEVGIAPNHSVDFARLFALAAMARIGHKTTERGLGFYR